MRSTPLQSPRLLSRRDMLVDFACGFPYLAFLGLAGQDALASNIAASHENPLAPKTPHLTPKAKQVIFLFMHGGVSHIDTFDPKPKLTEMDGQPMPGEKPAVTFSKTGNLMKSPWQFK